MSNNERISNALQDILKMKEATPHDKMKAQAQYCNEFGLPNFVPSRGDCYRCKNNIYTDPTWTDGKGARRKTKGISMKQAATELITGCPHCNYSFVD